MPDPYLFADVFSKSTSVFDVAPCRVQAYHHGSSTALIDEVMAKGDSKTATASAGYDLTVDVADDGTLTATTSDGGRSIDLMVTPPAGVGGASCFAGTGAPNQTDVRFLCGPKNNPGYSYGGYPMMNYGSYQTGTMPDAMLTSYHVAGVGPTDDTINAFGEVGTSPGGVS